MLNEYKTIFSKYNVVTHYFGFFVFIFLNNDDASDKHR